MMLSSGLAFRYPRIFWLGCTFITAGVLAHVPMFIHAADMGYRMVGMPMDTTMLSGMTLITCGLLLAWYGLMPQLASARQDTHDTSFHFQLMDEAPLNRQHWSLVVVLFVAVAVDVMKPATLSFVMPGLAEEYAISSQTAGQLALVALSGTTIGSIVWGRVADLHGRRAAILLSALMFIGTAICGAMPSFEWNLAMCFLMGMSAGGLLPITFTLLAEVIPAAHRGWLLVALGGVGSVAGYLLASGSAALLEPLFSWRVLWLLGLPTGLLVIFLNHHIPESARFLASKGLTHQARSILLQYNRDTCFSDHESPTDDAALQHDARGFGQLFLFPYVGLTLGLIGAGTAWGLVNFGFLLWLPTNLAALGMGAERANALLAQSGLLALPCVLSAIWLYHRWSSIKALVLFIILTAGSLGLFFILRTLSIEADAAVVGATALLLTSANGVIAMLIPYATEIYPLSLRGTGTGVVAASSKFGGILGAALGITGFFENMALSSLLIAATLLLCGSLLLRRGIDTRSYRLEDIKAAIISKQVLEG